MQKNLKTSEKNIEKEKLEPNKKDMAKINELTKKNLKKEDVYVFSVILCDNDIDRDNEAFTKDALNKLKKLFNGVTGIQDHEALSKNQIARIYETTIFETNEKTITNEQKLQLKAKAYIPINESTKNIIEKIEAGILKEVSVCCKVKNYICSICGSSYKNCKHQKGSYYKDNLCYIKLDEPIDAFEWSFVAVPAQKGAGVVKHYNIYDNNLTLEENAKIGLYYKNNLKNQVIKLSFLNNFMTKDNTFKEIVDGLNIKQLQAIKDEFSKNLKNKINFSSPFCCAAASKRSTKDDEINFKI